MSLKIGWSEKSITPDKKISLVGQFAERISEYVEKPLCATALAIDNGTDHAAGHKPKQKLKHIIPPVFQ